MEPLTLPERHDVGETDGLEDARADAEVLADAL